MNKEIPKTDRVTFITEKNNWLDAGGVKELKMNKSKDVVQIHFENGNIAEIHSCNPYGEGRGALVVSDLVSLANVKGDPRRSDGKTSPPSEADDANDKTNRSAPEASGPLSCSASFPVRDTSGFISIKNASQKLNIRIQDFDSAKSHKIEGKTIKIEIESIPMALINIETSIGGNKLKNTYKIPLKELKLLLSESNPISRSQSAKKAYGNPESHLEGHQTFVGIHP